MSKKNIVALSIGGVLLFGGLVNACSTDAGSPDAPGSIVATTTTTAPATPTAEDTPRPDQTGTVTPKAPRPTPTATVTPKETPKPTAEPEANLDPTAVKFGQTFKLDNGAEITVSKPAKFRSSNTAAPKQNAAGALFTVTVKNGTKVPMNLALATISAATGSADADEIFDSKANVMGTPSTRVRPGGSSSWKAAFLGDAGKPWIVDVSIDFGDETVTFIS